jgi:hypothetical protein
MDIKITLDKVSEKFEKIGIPGRDLYDLPASGKTFDDGCHYRIEMSGLEGPRVLEAMIKERRKLGVPVHRIVSFCQGANWFSDSDLKDFCQMAVDDNLEAVAIPTTRNSIDIGRQALSSDGKGSGFANQRGSDELRKVIYELFRLYEIGFRGLMLMDPYAVNVVKRLQDAGEFPRDVVIKLSAWAGISSPSGAAVVERLGVGSFNPITDLTLPQLASMRKVVDVPMDFYITTFDTYGGSNRTLDSAEVTKLCAPCYLKFEPAPAISFYTPYDFDSTHIELMEKKLKLAMWVVEHVSQNQPQIKLSPHGTEGLFLPKV